MEKSVVNERLPYLHFVTGVKDQAEWGSCPNVAQRRGGRERRRLCKFVGAVV